MKDDVMIIASNICEEKKDKLMYTMRVISHNNTSVDACDWKMISIYIFWIYWSTTAWLISSQLDTTDHINSGVSAVKSLIIIFHVMYAINTKVPKFDSQYYIIIPEYIVSTILVYQLKREMQ